MSYRMYGPPAPDQQRMAQNRITPSCEQLPQCVPITSRTVKAGKSCVTRHFGKCFTTCRIMHGPKKCIAEKCPMARLCLLLSLRTFCVVFRWKESCGRSSVLSTLLQSVLLISKQSLDVMACGLAVCGSRTSPKLCLLRPRMQNRTEIHAHCGHCG